MGWLACEWRGAGERGVCVWVVSVVARGWASKEEEEEEEEVEEAARLRGQDQGVSLWMSWPGQPALSAPS